MRASSANPETIRGKLKSNVAPRWRYQRPTPQPLAAGRHLVRRLARDLGLRGITVNNVQPRSTENNPRPVNGLGTSIIVGRTAVGWIAVPAEMVSYLDGPEADCATGATVTIGWLQHLDRGRASAWAGLVLRAIGCRRP